MQQGILSVLCEVKDKRFAYFFFQIFLVLFEKSWSMRSQKAQTAIAAFYAFKIFDFNKP